MYIYIHISIDIVNYTKYVTYSQEVYNNSGEYVLEIILHAYVSISLIYSYINEINNVDIHNNYIGMRIYIYIYIYILVWSIWISI